MTETWGGKSTFEYVGSVQGGTLITFGQGHNVEVSARQYDTLRRELLNNIIPVGTSRTHAPDASLGAWLQTHVTSTAIASYVAPILVLEGYAERVGKSDIRITR